MTRPEPLTREWLEAQLKLCEAATPGACALFVAARTDYPAVLREVIRLQAQIATAREVLGETIAMLNAQRRDMLSELPDDHQRRGSWRRR